MNVGTVEAGFRIDTRDLDKLPQVARDAMRRAQAEMDRASEAISAALKQSGAVMLDQYGRPALAAADANKKVAESSEAAARSMKNADQAAKSAGASYSSLGDSAKRAFEIFTGISLANLFADTLRIIKELTREMMRLGLEAQVSERSFHMMAASVGASGEELIAELSRISAGIINQSDVMLSAARAMQQGLSPEHLTGLMKVAASQAQLAGTSIVDAFNAITQAATTQQARALKQFGIILDLNKAYEEYAKRLHTYKEALTEAGQSEAVAEAIMRTMEGRLIAVDAATLSNAQKIEKMKSAWQDLLETGGKELIDTLIFLHDVFVQFKKDLDIVDTTVRDVSDSVQHAVETFKQWTGIDLTGIVTAMQKAFNIKPPEDQFAPLAKSVDAFGEAQMRAQPKIDATKDALKRNELAVMELNAAYQMGSLRSVQYAQALQGQIGALQAIAEPTDEVRTRILQLQVAIAGVRKQIEQSFASIGDVFGPLFAEIERLQGTDDAFDQALRPLTEFRDRLRATLSEMGVAPAAIDALDSSLRNLSRDLAEQVVMWRELAQMKKEALGLAVAMTPEGTQEQQDLIAAADAWAKLGLTMHDIEKTGSDALKMLQDQAAAAATIFKELRDRLGEVHPEVQRLWQRVVELADAARLLQTVRDTARDVAEAWDEAGDSMVKQAIALGTWSSAAAEAGREAELLGGALESTNAQIKITEDALIKAARQFGFDSDAVARLRKELSGLKADRFDQVMALIDAQAAVLGPRFDILGQRINAAQGRLKEMADEAKGHVTPEMIALGDAINHMIDEQQIQQAMGLTRTMFDTMVDAAQATAGNMHSAFSDFFFDIMVQDFDNLEDVVRNFGRSMLRVFSDILADAAVREVLSIFGFKGATTGGKSGGLSLSDLFGGVKAPATPTTPTAPAVPTTPEEALSGKGFGASDLSGSTTAIQWLDPEKWAQWGNVWSGMVDGWSSGATVFEGLTKAVQGAWDGFAGFNAAMSGTQIALGYAAAAIGTVLIALDKNKTNLGKAIQSATLVAGAVLAPYTFGLSLIAASIINWVEDLFGLFNKVSHYEEVRKAAREQAQDALKSVSDVFKNAVKGSSSDVLTALQSGVAGPRGSVRTALQLPADIAETMGIVEGNIGKVNQVIRRGDMVIAEWAAITDKQFEQLIALYRRQPELIKLIQGSGDVGYLSQKEAQEVADSVREGAIKLVQGFISLQEAREEIDRIVDQVKLTFTDILPPELADRFVTQMLEPFRTGLKAALTDPSIDADKLVADFQKEAENWQKLALVWETIGTELDSITNDFAAIGAKTAKAIEATMGALAREVVTAQSAFDAAVESGNVGRIAETAATLHDAGMKLYQAFMDIEKSVETAIADILDKVGAGIVKQLQAAAMSDLAAGNVQPAMDLVDALVAIGTTARSSAERMWALNQAMGVFVATMPGIIEQMQKAGTAPTTAAGMGQFILSEGLPILQAQQALIDAATGPAKLQLLQQQATMVAGLGQAALDGIQQWATAAIKGAQDAAALEEKKIDAQIAQIQEKANIEHAARQAEIEAIREAEAAAREVRQAEIQAMRDRLAAAKEWDQSVKSIFAFIQAQTLAPAAPINAKQQLLIAQQAFTDALGKYRAAPTAAGLAALPALAENVFRLAETVHQRPSQDFQRIWTGIMNQLRGAGALGQKQQPADVVALEAMLKQMEAADRAAGTAAAAQIKAIEDLDKAAAQGVKDQIEALNAQKAQIHTDLEATVTAIEKEARDAATEINSKISQVLRDNATAQGLLMKDQIDMQEAIRNALYKDLGSDIVSSLDAITRVNESMEKWLRDIRDKMIGAAAPTTVAVTEATVTSAQHGAWQTTEGLWHLHEDEMVLSPDVAGDVRKALSRMSIPRDDEGRSRRTGNVVTITNNFYAPVAKEDADLIARRTEAAVRKVQEEDMRFGRQGMSTRDRGRNR